MAIIQDWKIRSTGARCSVSGQEFEDEQDFYTCIFDDPESDGFIRRDYSVEAWEEVRKTLQPPPFSFWKSTYKAPRKEKVEDVSEDALMERILREFVEEDDLKTEKARYILALMLERKKILLHTDTKQTDTGQWMFYEHTASGDVFVIADPALQLSEVEDVQVEVIELLKNREAREAEDSEAVEEPAEQVAETGEDGTESGGDEASQPEDETVGTAHEQLADGV